MVWCLGKMYERGVPFTPDVYVSLNSLKSRGASWLWAAVPSRASSALNGQTREACIRLSTATHAHLTALCAPCPVALPYLRTSLPAPAGPAGSHP